MTPKQTANKKPKRILRLLIKLLIGLVLLAILLIALLDIFSVAILSSGYYLNWSSSMPIGLYKVTGPQNFKKGDVVVVCLPPSIGEEGLAREYLNPGKCAGGYSPIIKELIATPGDNVTLTPQTIIVNGQSYFAPLHTEDLKGRPLASFPRTEYKNTQNFWLYGAGNPADSWDSRYWGGVSEKDIIKQAHPVLVFP